MTKKLVVVVYFLLIFLYTTHTNAQDFKYVQIFDPKQDAVVKVVQLNPQIQSIIANWVKNIDDIYGKNNPFTDDGYAIRVPIEPAVKVCCNSFNAIVSEVYIIIPKTEPAFYLIFENENKASCFLFNGDINILSNILDFNLKL